jgi:Xaa-Pro aminopeptidase
MTSSSVFPREEFVERRKRTREALGRRNVDTLLVLSERNWYRDHAIRYLTGYDCPTSPTLLLLLPLEGASTLIVGTPAEAERAASFAGVETVRVAADGVAAALDWKRVQPKLQRLGIAGGECMGFSALDVLPRRISRAVHTVHPGLELVDVGGALLELRAVRSERELTVLRKAAVIANIGADAFFATMRAGVTERDLWSEIWYVMQRAGADDVHMSLCCGPRSFWPHPPSDAAFEPGDIVSVELSPRVDGYFSQSNRMCFVGSDSREWRELSSLATDALRVAVGAMRPGIPARDVVAQVSAFVGKTQLATMDIGGVHRIGHGCGLCVDEGPFLSSSSATELQPNMTIALHPIMYLPYRHSMLMLGDYVRIANDGVEVMTSPQTEIPVV